MKNLNQILQKCIRAVSYGPKLRPVRDWSFLILVTGIFIAASIAWNAWVFIEASSGKLVTSSKVGIPHIDAPINTSAVQSVFKTRATEENSYQSSYPIVDPSTPGS